MVSDDRVAKLLARIRSGKMTKTELKQFADNISRSPLLSDGDRQNLLGAIANVLRPPVKAGNRGAERETFAVKLLEEAFARSDRAFNLNGNAVENKVKFGGETRKGAAVVDVYISYKNNRHRSISLGIMQETETAAPVVFVSDTVVGSSRVQKHDFPIENFDDAERLYLSKLGEILPPVGQAAI